MPIYRVLLITTMYKFVDSILFILQYGIKSKSFLKGLLQVGPIRWEFISLNWGFGRSEDAYVIRTQNNKCHWFNSSLFGSIQVWSQVEQALLRPFIVLRLLGAALFLVQCIITIKINRCLL